MKRHVITPRPDWQKIVESQGFPFHSNGVRPEHGHGTHWREDVCYEFTTKQVEIIEAATNELHRVVCDGVERVVESEELLTKLQIPEAYWEPIYNSYHQNHPSIYGRFDLSFNPETNEVKMLEYNADTPTTLIESSVVQWHWLTDFIKERSATHENLDQFNSIHDKLVGCWKWYKDRTSGAPLYFSANRDALEEFATVEYLRDTANQAGIDHRFIHVGDIGWNGERFTDLDEKAITYIFKLYPWEWMMAEEFGQHVPTSAHATGWMEPLWKGLLSNKGILPILWESLEGHPNLLEAHFVTTDAIPNHGSWVRKPFLSREGHNVTMIRPDGSIEAETNGDYGHHPMILQERANLPKVDGHHVVLGSWVIGGESAGIIVREDESPIIVDKSAVVPHFFW